jgi:hypothetical protein
MVSLINIKFYFSFGIPLLIAFYTHFFRRLEKSKKFYQTLVIQGAGEKDILHFGSIKLSLIMGELCLLISSGFFSVDFLIYLQLKENFLVANTYQLPLFEWGVIQQQLKRTLKTILMIN